MFVESARIAPLEFLNEKSFRLRLGERTHDRAKFEEARRAVNSAFDVLMQAGQEHCRRYFEDRLQAIDRTTRSAVSVYKCRHYLRRRIDKRAALRVRRMVSATASA